MCFHHPNPLKFLMTKIWKATKRKRVICQDSCNRPNQIIWKITGLQKRKMITKHLFQDLCIWPIKGYFHLLLKDMPSIQMASQICKVFLPRACLVKLRLAGNKERIKMIYSGNMTQFRQIYRTNVLARVLLVSKQPKHSMKRPEEQLRMVLNQFDP